MFFVLVAAAGMIGFYAFMHGMGGKIVELQVDSYEHKINQFRQHLHHVENRPDPRVIETSYKVIR